MRFKIIFWVILLVNAAIGQKSVQQVFPMQWKTKIGTSTYRSNVVFSQGYLFAGSSGEDLNKDNDKLDGVYVINPKTGKTHRHISLPQLGDNDVNGIAVHEERLYFGTDNDYFYCFNWKEGKELWKFKTVNDCESVPVLTDMNTDGELDVIFNVQMDGVYVLNGETGELIWRNDSLGTHQGNSSPALYDVNGDGIKDVIATGRPIKENLSERWENYQWADLVYCLDGKTGSVIWLREMEAGIHASPVLVETAGYDHPLLYIRSVSDVMAYNVVDGRIVIDMSYNGSFGSMAISKMGLVFFGNEYAYRSDKKVFCVDMSCDPLGGCGYYWSDGGGIKIPKEDSYKSFSIRGNVSASPVIADVITGNKKKKNSVVNVGAAPSIEEVLIPSESGDLLILTEEGDSLMTLKLPAGSEATLFIEDIDGDGKLEIIQLALDGYIYCYATSSTSSAAWGSFRGPNNMGLFYQEE